MLARTLDRPLFQRTISMIGAPDMSNYTMQVDVMTDGNRRTMSTPGLVNQRYMVLLKGNHQALEITSMVPAAQSCGSTSNAAGACVMDSGSIVQQQHGAGINALIQGSMQGSMRRACL